VNISHMKSLPPVDNELPANEIGPLFRVAITFMDVAIISAEVIDQIPHTIDHTSSRVDSRTVNRYP